MQTISVVIPTLNRFGLLRRTLAALECQSLPRDQFEVIVVDNDSSDETLTFLASRARRFPNLRFLSQQRPGAAATRNRGLQVASGDIVLFVDDDIEADPGLLEAHLRYHSENADAAIIGAIQTRWESTRDPFLRYLRDRGIHNPYGLGQGQLNFTCYHTGNVSTPRSRLIAVGGFDERFTVYGMEDIEMGYRLERLGCRFIRGSRARAVHHFCPSYQQFSERCDEAGYSLGLMVHLHPELRERFTENGSNTRLLRPFHKLYGASEFMLRPLARVVERLDSRRGSGPVSRALGFHYDWALRYHFFLGYSRFLSNGHKRIEPQRYLGGHEPELKEPSSKVQSSPVAR